MLDATLSTPPSKLYLSINKQPIIEPDFSQISVLSVNCTCLCRLLRNMFKADNKLTILGEYNKRKLCLSFFNPATYDEIFKKVIILGFCRRGLAFSPCPDVLVTPSLKLINSIPLLSFTKQKFSISIS